MRGRVRGSWTAVGAGGWSMHEVSFAYIHMSLGIWTFALLVSRKAPWKELEHL